MPLRGMRSVPMQSDWENAEVPACQGWVSQRAQGTSHDKGWCTCPGGKGPGHHELPSRPSIIWPTLAQRKAETVNMPASSNIPSPYGLYPEVIQHAQSGCHSAVLLYPQMVARALWHCLTHTSRTPTRAAGTPSSQRSTLPQIKPSTGRDNK